MTDIKAGDKYVAKTNCGSRFQSGVAVTVTRIDGDGDIWYENAQGQNEWRNTEHFLQDFEKQITELDDKWIVWIPRLVKYFFTHSEGSAKAHAEAMAQDYAGEKVYIAKAQNMVVKGDLTWLN